MESVTIICPSRGRVKKLERMIASVPDLDWIRILVMADECEETVHALMQHPRHGAGLEVYHSPEWIGSVACRNRLAPHAQDGLLWICDDMEFLPGSIERARDIHTAEFPDGDGVVGFAQLLCGTYHPTGVGLMGRLFLHRYHGKIPFYPGYWLFASQEILWLCRHLEDQHPSLEFFRHEPACAVRHYHPARYPHELDRTHADGRRYKKQDQALARERERTGQIWGLQGQDQRKALFARTEH